MNVNNTTWLGKIKILMLKGEKGDKGDNGASGDYAGLTNKPSINGETLDGALTSDDLGLAPASGLQQVADDLAAEIQNVVDYLATAKTQISIPTSPSRFNMEYSSLYAYKSGQTVTIAGHFETLSRTTIQTADWFNIGTVPNECKPDRNQFFWVRADSDYDNRTCPMINVCVNTDGDINMRVVPIATSGDHIKDIDYIEFCATYLVM